VTGWPVPLVLVLAACALHLRGRRRLVRAARAGHEVRGPLCTAQLALEGLERSARVEAIGLELRRAALALDDLAGARRARPARERVDLARLLAAAADGWRAMADARGVGLAVQPGRAVVAGDPLRLSQALANLVANAIEHGGGHVRVSSSAGGGRARVEVADLGRGLPAPLEELVAAARGRRTARGHGLAIAAGIARRHGGRLTTVPVPRGTLVLLDLPEAPGTTRRRSLTTPPWGRRSLTTAPWGRRRSPRASSSGGRAVS
jgi:signal transduction histidine kinase